MGKDEATPEKDFSFTKAERLLKPAEFTAVRKLGKRLSTRSFNIYLLENKLGRRRLGLSISSRVGPAVRRNRIKRLLREFFRLNKALFPASTDILVTGKGVERIKGLKEIEEELKAALTGAQKKP
ncbi:MAG: ribonuclease P protein component [Deltaproteobacteria bacterium]|nr:ribonuclease P protein component [Deltaproteobacteria bacterium]